jgi:tryptophan-rich sensory protein
MPVRGGFLLRLLVFGVLSFGAAGLGSQFTARGLGAWYDGLAKPPWTPPGGVIGAVWTVLFALLAIASALVWKNVRPAGYTIVLVVNLILNVLWSYLFFARRNPVAALQELLVLEASCLALIAMAAPLSRAAAILLVPYSLWVAFAGFLNWTIVRMNR